jgi:integrase
VAAGLRAHELFTLCPSSEGSPSAHRSWDPRRFTGREGVRYLVTGKGGLVREVLLPRALAAELETRRLASLRPVTDRGVRYQQRYDLGGGRRFSSSFSAASRRVLGFTRGAHGLRHAYAADGLAELMQQGYGFKQARAILAQEMGHFRGEVTRTYLR